MTFDEWWATRALGDSTAPLPLMRRAISEECRLAWTTALEEAAKVVEGLSGDSPYEDTTLMAEEIRSLKTGPNSTRNVKG